MLSLVDLACLPLPCAVGLRGSAQTPCRNRPGCRNPVRFGHPREAPYKPVRNGSHGHLFVTGLGGCTIPTLNITAPSKGTPPLCGAVWMAWLFAKKVVSGDPPWLPLGILDAACLVDFPNALPKPAKEPVPSVVTTAAHDGLCSCMPAPLYSIAIVPWLAFPVFAVMYNSGVNFPV